MEEAFRAAHGYAEKPEGWLLLQGPYGAGKTHLAAAIANYRDSQGYPVMFVVVPDLLDHLRATFSPDSTTTYDQRFEELRSAPLLVLDDLGTQATTPWVREKLYQLFNHRYNAALSDRDHHRRRREADGPAAAVALDGPPAGDREADHRPGVSRGTGQGAARELKRGA